jgi:hypothetical protein
MLRATDAAAVREIGAIVNRREVLDMSDPNWISVANAHQSEPFLSKVRTDFGHGGQQPNDPFLRHHRAAVKSRPNVTANHTQPSAECDPAASAKYDTSKGHWLAENLAGANTVSPTVCKVVRLDDCIFQDIGLARSELLCEAKKPSWR